MAGEFMQYGLHIYYFYFDLFFLSRFSKIFILQESSGVNFSICLLMMILDTLLYCAIGLYFDKV